VPVGGATATLAGLVAERNDATLAEYADLLAERAGVRRSPSALCRALKGLGLARKKDAPGRRAGPRRRRRGAGGVARRSRRDRSRAAGLHRRDRHRRPDDADPRG
jgi:hypothetical protein